MNTEILGVGKEKDSWCLCTPCSQLHVSSFDNDQERVKMAVSDCDPLHFGLYRLGDVHRTVFCCWSVI